MTVTTEMTSKDNTFEELFAERLPLELRQAVLKHAAANDSGDVEICLSYDNADSLEAPAIDFLKQLEREHSNDLYLEAVQYLTGPTFRWVFVSDRQPHRYLLSIFRSQVLVQTREPIRHIYLRHMEVASLLPPATLRELHMGWWTDSLERRPDCSVYQQGLRNPSDLLNRVRKDIRSSMMLVPTLFPSVNKLDVDFDICDCVCEYDIRDLASRLRCKLEGIFTAIELMRALSPLVNTGEISKFNIRIFWGDYFKRGRESRGKIDKKEEELKNVFIPALHQIVAAECITSHTGD